MNRGFKSTGILTAGELHNLPGVPPKKRMKEGPVAVIECAEEFPCNPCESACAHGAIIIGQPITNLPRLDEDSCIGCGECIDKCPGLAIFMMDMGYSEKEAAISFPFEFLFVPKVGEHAKAVDRSGKVITMGKVVEVRNLPSQDHTAVLTVVVPKQFGWDVRGIQRRGSEGQ